MHKCLTYENAALEESDPDKESVLDGVKSAVCQVRDSVDVCTWGVDAVLCACVWVRKYRYIPRCQ